MPPRSDECSCNIELCQELGEWRNLVVALYHDGYLAQEVAGLPVKRPDGIGNGMVVRIDEQATLVIAMAGQVNLANAVRGQSREVDERIEIVIASADIDIIHVKQEITARSLTHLG